MSDNEGDRGRRKHDDESGSEGAAPRAAVKKADGGDKRDKKERRQNRSSSPDDGKARKQQSRSRSPREKASRKDRSRSRDRRRRSRSVFFSKPVSDRVPNASKMLGSVTQQAEQWETKWTALIAGLVGMSYRSPERKSRSSRHSRSRSRSRTKHGSRRDRSRSRGKHSSRRDRSTSSEGGYHPRKRADLQPKTTCKGPPMPIHPSHAIICRFWFCFVVPSRIT